MSEETKSNIEEVLLDIGFYEKDLSHAKSDDEREELIKKIDEAEELFKILKEDI